MKHIPATLLTLALAGFAAPALAAESDRNLWIVTSEVDEAAVTESVRSPQPHPLSQPGPRDRVALAAPRLDATAPPAAIDPPIPAGTIDLPDAPAVDVPSRPQDARHSHHRVEKKKSVIDKLMDLERKKNAWLKRTFLGR